MLKIGLTGGIGSGKSTVANLFASFNVPIIDADVIAHQLVALGQPTLQLLSQAFGASILDNAGRLNRSQLKELVFNDNTKRKKLETILHPLIYAQMQTEIAALTTSYCIICIPLLIETQKIDFVDRVLVIDCQVSEQIARVKKRDQLNEQQILAIIAAQTTRKERLAVANDVIENTQNSPPLAEQVKKLHNLYILLSSV